MTSQPAAEVQGWRALHTRMAWSLEAPDGRIYDLSIHTERREAEGLAKRLTDLERRAALNAQAQAEGWRLLATSYRHSHNQRGSDGPCDCGDCRTWAALDAPRAGVGHVETQHYTDAQGATGERTIWVEPPNIAGEGDIP